MTGPIPPVVVSSPGMLVEPEPPPIVPLATEVAPTVVAPSVLVAAVELAVDPAPSSPLPSSPGHPVPASATSIRISSKPSRCMPKRSSNCPLTHDDRSEIHQSCVRLARADYCGDGVPYTKNGTLIAVSDFQGIVAPEADPGDMLFEAGWGPATRGRASPTPRPPRRG